MPTVRSWKVLALTTRRASGGRAGLELSVMRIKVGVGEMGKGRRREGREPADRAPGSLPHSASRRVTVTQSRVARPGQGASARPALHIRGRRRAPGGAVTASGGSPAGQRAGASAEGPGPAAR